MSDDYPYGYLPLGSEKLAAGKQLEMGDEGAEDEVTAGLAIDCARPSTA
jgi:hypothetical protein